MQNLLNWLQTLDKTTIYTLLITAVTTYGGSMVAIVVGLLKTRLKNINLQQEIKNVELKLLQKQNELFESLNSNLVSNLDDVKSQIIANNKEQELKRLNEIGLIEKQVEETNKNIESNKNLQDIINEVI